jgi:hypothetical protein
MQLETAILRDPGEHRLPASVVTPLPRPNHRPKTEYHLHPETEADVTLLQRRGMPLHVLTSTKATDLGYPVTFPTQVVFARAIQARLDLPPTMGSIPFISIDAARAPRDEDVVVALLRFDMIGARAVFDANVDRFERTYVLRRILEERVEERAAFVRFTDVLPGIPSSADALSALGLARKLRKHAVNRSRR